MLRELTTEFEIPSGLRIKYERDTKTGLRRLDRVLYWPVYYPHYIGFIGRTLAEDDDPLGVLALSQRAAVLRGVVANPQRPAASRVSRT
jgi:inorganic pyrophosphatase